MIGKVLTKVQIILADAPLALAGDISGRDILEAAQMTMSREVFGEVQDQPRPFDVVAPGYIQRRTKVGACTEMEDLVDFSGERGQLRRRNAKARLGQVARYCNETLRQRLGLLWRKHIFNDLRDSFLSLGFLSRPDQKVDFADRSCAHQPGQHGLANKARAAGDK